MDNKDMLVELINDATKYNDCDIDKLADCIIKDGWIRLPYKAGDILDIKTIKSEAYKEFGNKLEKAFQESERQMPNNEIVKQTVQICRNAIKIVLKELAKEDK